MLRNLFNRGGLVLLQLPQPPRPVSQIPRRERSIFDAIDEPGWVCQDQPQGRPIRGRLASIESSEPQRRYQPTVFLGEASNHGRATSSAPEEAPHAHARRVQRVRIPDIIRQRLGKR